MLAFTTVLLMLIMLFGVLGMMRGWGKEILATAGIILALFIDDRLLSLTPIQGVLIGLADNRSRFWVRSLLFLLIVFFAYQGPMLSEHARSRLQRRGTAQESLLGLITGLVNGFLVVGTVWYFLRIYCYPFSGQFIIPPIDNVTSLPVCAPPSITSPEIITMLAQAGQFVGYLPLVWITPFLPYLLAMFFLFVMIAFI